MNNIFCKMDSLKNESDVEQFFIVRLLNNLGYKDVDIHTKETISIKKIGKGTGKKDYRPDYNVYVKNYPVIVIDVKHPKIDSSDGLSDSLMYSRAMNGEYIGQNPIKYCIGSNGYLTQICKWDENKPFLEMEFKDFQIENPKYNELITLLSFENIELKKEVTTVEAFEFKKPDIHEINGIFKKCHQLIWKKEKTNPTSSFYEFCKIMFIKLNEDKKLVYKLESGEKLEKEDFIFSLHWIEKQEKTSKNPVNSILFKNLKEELEDKISSGEKKRIFEENEQINLKPSTIKQVIKLIENYNLISIDEDLNGKLFESFLTATMRGKELGQYFTPRNVVRFMTKMAGLEVDFRGKKIDRVLDGCCGTGGFLIEVMADLSEKINQNISITQKEKNGLLKKVRCEQIYGVEASPMISRIARINMYLHGDGGSKIYNLDSLDKKVTIEPGLNKELSKEYLEYKNSIMVNELKFDVILTNPPFSMRYSKNDPEEKTILEDYYLAHNKVNNEIFSTLQSNIMFIERYCELLKPHGKLMTIIDESVLNTPSNTQFRDFIRKNFIIKAVISLPENTFVKADTGVKSSILYLIKKETGEEPQPAIFMALCENIGHNDSGRNTPELNELFESKSDYQNDYSKGILGDFFKFENGKFKNVVFDPSQNKVPEEKMWKSFILNSLDGDRLDVKSNSPYLKCLREVIKSYKWDYLGNLIKIEKKESPIVSDFYRLIDLRNVEEKTACILKIDEVDELNSDKILFKINQLLISMLSPEKGKVIFVDECLDGCVGSSEFKPATLKDKKITIEYLWVILRSKLVLDQWKFQVTGSTPSRYRIGEVELKNTIIPVPDTDIQNDYSSKVISTINENTIRKAHYQQELKDLEKKYTSEILR